MKHIYLHVECATFTMDESMCTVNSMASSDEQNKHSKSTMAFHR